VTHKIDPDVDEARNSLIEDIVISQQLAKNGWVKNVGAATRAKPKYNLTGDHYFTDGYRSVLVFDRRPRSFMEIDRFDWEQPISNRIERLETDREPDFDEQ
jgi:hypothetical protein